MKVQKVIEFQKKYDFEAPVFSATHKSQQARDTQNKDVYSIDLNSYLIPNSKTHFIVKVSGESMIKDNIYDGDLLIVDKSATAIDGKVVIASLNDEMTVKRYRVIDGVTYLFAANDKFLPIEISPFWQFEIQGVVKHVIRNV